MIKKYLIIFVLLLASCSIETPKTFSNAALNDKISSVNDEVFAFSEILDKYKGKIIFIDFWASWCRDCLVSLPKVKALQQKYSNTTFLFISVDKNQKSWKRAIKKYKITGEHFNLSKGMDDGALVDFVNLGWIPRYMIVNEKGEIEVFKAVRTYDKAIHEALKKY